VSPSLEEGPSGEAYTAAEVFRAVGSLTAAQKTALVKIAKACAWKTRYGHDDLIQAWMPRSKRVFRLCRVLRQDGSNRDVVQMGQVLNRQIAAHEAGGRRPLGSPSRCRSGLTSRKRIVFSCDFSWGAGRLVSLRSQCVPGRERIHVISPVCDLSLFELDDRAKPIVVLHARREDLPMDLVFNDDDAAVARLVDDQLIGRLKRDAVDVAPERGHQVGPPLNDARPAGNVVEDFIDDVVEDDVEEVLAIDEVAQRPSNQIEVREGGPVGSVFRVRHSDRLSALRVAYEMRVTY
jgi:hypothetical protein